VRVATCVWTIRPEVVEALDERLGTPVDSYVNGSQTWLTADGPGGIGLEWRLHPVAAYRPPEGLGHYELWDAVVGALAAGQPATALALGAETRPLASLWDGLECFPAYGDELEPAPLARAVTERLGIEPDHAGLVDHEVIADEWERTRGGVSALALVVQQLAS
jgi:hypothetical protein